jgi:hypothetical protein
VNKKIARIVLFAAVVVVAVIALAGNRWLKNSLPGSLVQASGGLTPQPITTPGFPAPSAVVESWINNNNQDAMRVHGWALWEGISSITPRSNGWPVWETWYTDGEVQSGPPNATGNLQARQLRAAGRPVHPFHEPRQFRHLLLRNRFAPALAAIDTGSQVVGFNKFDLDYSQFVWNNSYNSGPALWKIQKNWPAGAPVASRALKPFPSAAIALKPVFQIVHGPSNQSGITLLNYWLGDLTTGPQNSTNPVNPTWNTWKQCVVVNTGSGPIPSDLACSNGGSPAGVVPVSQFFNFALSPAEATEICSTVIGQPDLQCPVQSGDFAILVAMHMATREDSNWTWQTFWWNYSQPFPYGAPPSSVPAPFNNYAMCTGYSMTINPPNSPQGANVVCYNPYLETGLTGINGVGSDCMSCHIVASYGNNVNNPPNPPAPGAGPNPSYPLFSGSSYISVNNPQDDVAYFDCNTTTEFSWFLAGSVAGAATPPKQPPCTITPSR